MKSDLDIPKVHGVEVAAVRRAEDDELWDMYIINQNEFALKNVLITSRGYGKMADGSKQNTSILRHMIEHVEARSAEKIEPIQQAVLHLTNEYWVSYYVDEKIYDKKYIFLPDSIQENNITEIKGFDMRGVLHK